MTALEMKDKSEYSSSLYLSKTYSKTVKSPNQSYSTYHHSVFKCLLKIVKTADHDINQFIHKILLINEYEAEKVCVICVG